jgi:hypothetical protein
MRSTEVIGARLPRSAADALKQRAAAANTSAGAVIRAALDALKTPEVRAAVAQLAPELRAALAPITALNVASEASREVAPQGSGNGRVRVIDPKLLKASKAAPAKAAPVKRAAPAPTRRVRRFAGTLASTPRRRPAARSDIKPLQSRAGCAV